MRLGDLSSDMQVFSDTGFEEFDKTGSVQEQLLCIFIVFGIRRRTVKSVRMRWSVIAKAKTRTDIVAKALRSDSVPTGD